MKNKLNSLITQTKNITKQLLTTFIVLAITIIGGNFIVKAFTEPTQSPEDWTPTPAVSSPFTASGTDIYYNDGNVGIGTTNPQAKLDVNGTIIASTPTADNEVATKGYVDALLLDKTLTWSGSERTEQGCIALNGIVYDTGGSGTICKFEGNNVVCPSGWTQAGFWSSYNSSTARGDACGRFKSTGCPTTFSNQNCSGPKGCESGGYSSPDCSHDTNRWHQYANSSGVWCIAGNPVNGYGIANSGINRGRTSVGCY